MTRYRYSLRPKLFTTLRGYTVSAFQADAVAGLVVGIVALPLAIAFAIASGVSPEKGLITAIVAGFLISALGGSRVQIGGPTGAFVVIIYGIVEKYGIDGLTLATLLAGGILVVMGLARFGSLIKFIPHPLIVGFTSGIAVIIASSEVRDFLGLTMPSEPAEFFSKWAAFAKYSATVNPYAVGLAVMGVVVIRLWPKVSRRIPGALVALLLGTALAKVFHFPVETIGSRFGNIPHTLPMPHWPHWNWETLHSVVRPAFAIAMLAAIESLLSATVADGMIGTRHRSNMELVAQGVANAASALFGGIPATGAIARTATNVKNGGRTPVAGIVHAVTLMLLLLAFGRYVVWIPLSSLAAILMIVAYNMSEWRTFRSLLRGPRSDALVLTTTFGLTVIVDLIVAIEAGMVMAVLLFLKQMSEAVQVNPITNDLREDRDPGEDMPLERRQIPAGVEVYEINGPLFFGAAFKFEEAISAVAQRPKVLIIRLRNLLTFDATGLYVLEQVHRNCRAQGIVLIFSGIRAQALIPLRQSGLAAKIGEEHFLPDLDSSLAWAAKMTEGNNVEIKKPDL